VYRRGEIARPHGLGRSDRLPLADVTPAVGIADAHDAMHLVALAIVRAGSSEGPKIRKASTRSTDTTS
jgi:hypothetical protein